MFYNATQTENWSEHFVRTGAFCPFVRLSCEGAAWSWQQSHVLESGHWLQEVQEAWAVCLAVLAGRPANSTCMSTYTIVHRTVCCDCWRKNKHHETAAKVIASIFRAEIPVESPPLEASVSIHSKKCAYVTFEAYRFYRHMKAAVVLLYSALRTPRRSVSRLLVFMVHSAFRPTPHNEFNKWFP